MTFIFPWIPFNHIWLKSAQLFWWKRFLNIVNVFSLYMYHYFLHFRSLGWFFIWTNFNLDKETKIRKVYDDNNDDGQWTNFDQEGSQNLCLQVSKTHNYNYRKYKAFPSCCNPQTPYSPILPEYNFISLFI